MGTQHPHPFGQFWVAGRDQTALAHGNGLDRMEAEHVRVGMHARTNTPRRTIGPRPAFPAECVTRVLDDAQAARIGHRLDCRHVHKFAVKVHGKDCTHATTSIGCQRSPQMFGGEQTTVRVNVCD